MMVTVDTRSLFTNIPINSTINLNDVKTFIGLTKTQLNKLLIQTCKGTVHHFNGQVSEQISCVAVGSRNG